MALSPETLQNGVVRFTQSHWGTLVVGGPDACRFLQGQTTQDILALKPGMSTLAAILKPTGQIRFVATVFCPKPSTYWLILPQGRLDQLQDALEAVCFTESLTLTPLDADWRYDCFVGPYAPAVCQALERALGTQAFGFSWPTSGEMTRCIAVPVALWARYEDILHTSMSETVAVTSGQKEDWDFWTLANGLPQWPEDLPENLIVSETPLEPLAVSLTKGCYVGQEVVTRIRTQGRPPKSMMGLRLTGHINLPPTGTPVSRNGHSVGTLLRGQPHPNLHETWAWVLIKRGESTSVDIENWTLGDNPPCPGRLVTLPFMQPPNPKALSDVLYNQAVEAVTAHQEAKAIALLTQALALNPGHADATEVLGVLYSQTGAVDKAIVLMHQLAQLEPQSVMAHTNLSRFYLQLGDKDRAETEKARATVLQFQQAFHGSGVGTPATSATAEEARKITMFEDVLTLDPEDPLANYSLGNLYLGQGQVQKALPLLQQAITTDPRYSVAYLALGKTYEALGNPLQAIETYQKGVAIAQKQGDLMPLQSMELRLQALH